MQDDLGDKQAVGSVVEQAAPAEAAPTPDQEMAATLAGLLKAINSGGSWFYWVAGLSVVNTLISVFKGDWSFLFGLGATLITDSFIQEYGRTAILIGLPINLFIAGIYALFGYFALRRMKWAFVIGIIVYFLDMLLCILVQQWLFVAFHAWVLFSIFRGLSAVSPARRLEEQITAMRGQRHIGTQG